MRRSVSGLVKILHPHGQVSQADLAELLELALEGRRRVKVRARGVHQPRCSQPPVIGSDRPSTGALVGGNGHHGEPIGGGSQ